MSAQYIGRFAPSPTGPLHLGSLYTAVASYLDARAHQGKWLLRIEDLDPPREQAGATEQIIHSLRMHGLHWDDNIILQSQRHARYEETIQQLLQQQLCYYCSCSRKDLAGYDENYPGFCRSRHLTGKDEPCAIRLRAEPPAPAFTDRHLGRQQPQPLPAGLVNDFVIKRKDGLYAYQLAVVVDDIAQGVNHIVRGSDILESTFKQLYLYRYLQATPPTYLHLPVINNPQGQKLSKQNLAAAIDDNTPCANLLLCLQLLNQPPPPPDGQQTPAAILAWAGKHWDIRRLPQNSPVSS